MSGGCGPRLQSAIAPAEDPATGLGLRRGSAMVDLGVTSDQAFKRMKLRYAGSCRSCATPLPAGTLAMYDRAATNVCCLSCLDSSVPTVASSAEPEHPGQPTMEGSGHRREPSGHSNPAAHDRSCTDAVRAPARGRDLHRFGQDRGGGPAAAPTQVARRFRRSCRSARRAWGSIPSTGRVRSVVVWLSAAGVLPLAREFSRSIASVRLVRSRWLSERTSASPSMTAEPQIG